MITNVARPCASACDPKSFNRQWHTRTGYTVLSYHLVDDANEGGRITAPLLRRHGREALDFEQVIDLISEGGLNEGLGLRKELVSSLMARELSYAREDRQQSRASVLCALPDYPTWVAGTESMRTVACDCCLPVYR